MVTLKNMELKELLKIRNGIERFEKARDDSKYIDNQLSLFNLDISNGCVESCEVF